MPAWRLLVLSFLLPCGCQKAASTPDAATAGEPAPVIVKVVVPKKQTINWSIEQPGTVQPFEVTPLVGKLSGYVRRVRVDIGDKVQGPKFDAQGKQTKPGQLLAEIDIPEMVEEAVEKRRNGRSGGRRGGAGAADAGGQRRPGRCRGGDDQGGRGGGSPRRPTSNGGSRNWRGSRTS